MSVNGRTPVKGNGREYSDSRIPITMPVPVQVPKQVYEEACEEFHAAKNDEDREYRDLDAYIRDRMDVSVEWAVEIE